MLNLVGSQACSGSCHLVGEWERGGDVDGFSAQNTAETQLSVQHLAESLASPQEHLFALGQVAAHTYIYNMSVHFAGEGTKKINNSQFQGKNIIER